jgi:ribosomal protein L24, bacterial/organelle
MGLYKSSKKNTNHFVHVRRDDTVIVVSGDDKGKKGKVMQVAPKEGKIIVEGVNTVSKHVKPRRQGEPGGIIKTDAAIYACKVMLYCPKCEKGVRIKHRITESKDKFRVCATCGGDI